MKMMKLDARKIILTSLAILSSVAVITGLRFVLQSLLGQGLALTLYLVAVIVTSLLFGRLAGIVTTLLAVLIGSRIFLKIDYSPVSLIEIQTYARAAVFTFVGIVCSLICGQSRAHRNKIDQLINLARMNAEKERLLRLEVESHEKEQFEVLRSLEANRNRLKASEHHFNKIIKASGIGVWYSDLDRDSIDCSVENRNHFFLPPEAVVTKSLVHSRIHPEELANADGAYEQAILNGGSYAVEVRTIDPEIKDHYRWILSSGWVFVQNGVSDHLDGISIDITQSKLAMIEKDEAKRLAEKASEGKSRFLAQMSHEIRSPMNAILGFTQILIENSAGEADEGRQQLERMKINGDHLLQIIDDILDLSKFEAGKVMIEEIDFSLHDLLRDILSSFKAPADDKSISLKLEIAAEVPERIATDETRLKQILYNLLGNALKFSTQGTISVRVAYKDRSQQILQFEIEDDGIGISEERRDKLFQPFESLEFNRDHPLDGTGLGLVLSKRLAEALGGDLDLIHSQAGKGSCFGFTIKIVESSSGRGADSKAVKATPVSLNLKGIQVLLAEDSPDGAVLVSRILSRAEAYVSIATNGFEVLELIKGQRFDVILMDVQMPGMDGLEATRVLRDNGVKIPILALTAHALPEERRRSFEAGCDAHLTKPIDKRALLAAVHHWAEKNGDDSV